MFLVGERRLQDESIWFMIYFSFSDASERRPSVNLRLTAKLRAERKNMQCPMSPTNFTVHRVRARQSRRVGPALCPIDFMSGYMMGRCSTE